MASDGHTLIESHGETGELLPPHFRLAGTCANKLQNEFFKFHDCVNLESFEGHKPGALYISETEGGGTFGDSSPFVIGFRRTVGERDEWEQIDFGLLPVGVFSSVIA